MLAANGTRPPAPRSGSGLDTANRECDSSGGCERLGAVEIVRPAPESRQRIPLVLTPRHESKHKISAYLVSIMRDVCGPPGRRGRTAEAGSALYPL